MALTAGNPITSADINDLKTRVKAEMTRRNATNSLASYNGDFSQSAGVGDLARISHFNETVGYINLIKPTGISSDLIYAIQAASDALATHAGVSKTVNSESCSAATCRGLCYTACSGSCRGCTSCSSTCGQNGCTSCSSTCGRDGCTRSCASGCWGGCVNACAAFGCGSNCTADCAFSCYTTSR